MIDSDKDIAPIVKVLATRWSGRLEEDFVKEAASLMPLADIFFVPIDNLVESLANAIGESVDLVRHVATQLVSLNVEQTTELARRSTLSLSELEAELTASAIERLFDAE